jgi:hypothetical protein
MQNTGTVQRCFHELAVVRLFATASFVLALAAACCITAAASKADGDDFVQDYVSARAWLSGENAYRDLNAMRVANGFPRNEQIPFNPHPPLAILLATPFAFSHFAFALRLYQCCQILTLASAWVLTLRLALAMWPSLPVVAGGAMVIGLWPPVWQGLDWGQPVGFLALATLAILTTARAENAFASGAALAAGVGIRPYYLFMSAGWSRWSKQVVLPALAAAVLISLVPFVSVGCTPFTWLERAISVRGFIAGAGTLPGLLRLGYAGGLMLSISGVCLAWFIGRRFSPEAAGAFGLVVGLIVYPMGWFHYDAVLVPVVAWALVRADQHGRPAARWLTLLYILTRLVPIVSDPPLIQMWAQVCGRCVMAIGVLISDQGRGENLEISTSQGCHRPRSPLDLSSDENKASPSNTSIQP